MRAGSRVVAHALNLLPELHFTGETMPMNKPLLIPLVAGVLLTLFPCAAKAQQPLDVRPSIPLDSLVSEPLQSRPSTRPTVEVRAAVRASELRFEARPRATVRAWACPGVDTVHVERNGLPDPVEPGVTYRNVSASIQVHAALAADTTLLRMLGVRGQTPPLSCPTALPAGRAPTP